jgi:hypothetical protein
MRKILFFMGVVGVLAFLALRESRRRKRHLPTAATARSVKARYPKER